MTITAARRRKLVQFTVDDPRETGCYGFVFRIGRAAWSFTWRADG